MRLYQTRRGLFWMQERNLMRRIEQLMKVSPKSYYVYAECWEDILSVPADIIVANPTTIEKEGIETIVEYFDCIDPIETTLILTEPCNALCGIESNI